MEWIFQLLERLRKWTLGFSIYRLRLPHLEGLMRPFVIELLPKFIKALLLLKKASTCRARRLLLEGQVHPLVSAVLFGMAWLDSLELNSEAHPPDGKLTEAKESTRSEGRPVIRSHGVWNSIFLKYRLKCA